jgi:hypothetical protein
MEEILLFLRTSLRKNPEEWSYIEQYRSIDTANSVMNVFLHEPTQYVLFLINSKPLDYETREEKNLYYVHLMEEEDYLDILENMGLRPSLFSPHPDFTYLVNENSSIIKTLHFIKHIALEDEKLLKYEQFKNYIREKNAPVEEEKLPKVKRARKRKEKKIDGDGDNISSESN